MYVVTRSKSTYKNRHNIAIQSDRINLIFLVYFCDLTSYKLVKGK
jgi:hypothetical protein